ncbi:MAG: DMT family transporter [Spirochaetota bacterium]
MPPTRATQAITSRAVLAIWSVGFVLLWNSGFIGAEVGMAHSGPFTLLLWRYLALTAVMATIVAVRGEPRRLPVRQLASVALVGLLSHGVWLSCVLVAIDRGVPAGIVALVVALQPLLTGAFSGLATGEHTSVRQWIGLVVGFAGVAIAVSGRLVGGAPAATGYYLLPLGSAAAITIASLIQRRRELDGSRGSVPIGLQLLIQSAATSVALAVPAFALESLRTTWVPEYAASMVWLVLGVSLGAYALMWRLLARASATRIASLFFLGPPVTMFMAWIGFGDAVIATDVAGLAVAGGGVALVTIRRPAKE